MKDNITEININYFGSSLAHIAGNNTTVINLSGSFQTSSSDANTVNLIIDTSHVRTNKKLSCRRDRATAA